MRVPSATIALLCVVLMGCAVAPSGAGGLTVCDANGRPRLVAREGADGRFSLVMLDTEGVECAELTSGRRGEAEFVLGADGEQEVRIGRAPGEDAWRLHLTGPQASIELSAGSTTSVRVASPDDSGDAEFGLAVDGKPRLRLGADARDHVVLGAREDGDWVVAVDGGAGVCGLVGGARGSTVAITDSGGERQAWMSAGAGGSEMGVRGSRPDASVVIAQRERFHGLVFRDEELRSGGLVQDREGASVLWFGGEPRELPSPDSGGLFAQWSPSDGAALSLRASEQTAGLLLVDSFAGSSGLAIGERGASSVRLGVMEGSGQLKVWDKAGKLLVDSDEDRK
ncbi:MAG: hypothetical protein KAI24_10705 [Planctomycetes bacterium]|nr:hypothetical protein [Planctomycetota bacterium]